MPSPNNNKQEGLIDEAVQKFVETQLTGQDLDADAFAKQYPDVEHQIKERIRDVQRINALFDSLAPASDREETQIVGGVLSSGSQVGHFRIEQEIGRGGMGVVYLARDTKLDRHVAIKSMPRASWGSATAQMRFQREAKLLASLSHPNIAVIHEIIEVEGLTYLILEYVPGDTLAQRLVKGPLKLKETLSIGQQIAEAVSAAHEKGVIHRDLKPGNIKLTPDGRVKVLDFGLAKPVREAVSRDTTITRDGQLLGTPTYMSPEQIRGKPVDHRTDIWSFGCVLYEMLTGKTPFEGETVSDTVAHVLEREPDCQLLPVETPPSIQGLLCRCLEKDPQDRPDSIREAALGIGNVLSPSAIASSAGAPATPLRQPPSMKHWRRIAVLPFVNMSTDAENEYFGDGLAEELINALAQIEGLRVVARTSAFQFKGQTLDVREIGQRLNAEIILEGSVRKAGNQLRVTAQLIDVADGYHIWSQRYARELADVFAIQDAITEEISGALKVELAADTKRQLAKRHTENVEAYNLYLRGRFYWNKRTSDGFTKAVAAFERALEIDPHYAMAQAGLADCYALMGIYGLLRGRDAMPKARAAALRALEINDVLPGPHGALALVRAIHDHDWQAAERHFQRALTLDPDDAAAHAWRAWFVLIPTGQLEAAETEARHALELDPVNPAIDVTLGFVYHMQCRDDEAVKAYQGVVELDPDHPAANFWLGEAYVALGRYAEAIVAYERLGAALWAVAGRALALDLSGKRSTSQKLLDKLTDAIRDGAPGTAVWIARTYARLGEIDLAFKYFEKAYQDRDTQVIWLKVDPFCASLRSDPRFTSLLRRMNLPPAAPPTIAPSPLSVKAEGGVKQKPWRMAMAVVAAVLVILASITLWSTVVKRASPPPKEIRLVVLPFENLGPADDAYFAAGITDAITARLAGIHGLSVVSRQSARQYKSSKESAREIGEKLNVEYILEGTIQRERPSDPNSGLRIIPQLVSVSDDAHVWAQSYDSDTSKVFELQSNVAERVAEALGITLLEAEQQALQSKPTESVEAYQYHLRGKSYLFRDYGEANLRIAIRMYEKAIDLDPTFALAYADLSAAHVDMYWFHYDRSEERLTLSKQAIDKALQLDPDLPEAHKQLGWYYYHGLLDYERALEQFAIALISRPNDHDLVYDIAAVQRRQGRFEQAVTNFRKASELEPLLAWSPQEAGQTLLLLRRYSEAEACYDRAISLSPDWANPYRFKAWLYVLWQGSTEKARAVMQTASQHIASTDPLVVDFLVMLDVYDRDYEAALDRLALMPESVDDQYGFMMPTALRYAQIYGYMNNNELEQRYYESTRKMLETKIQEWPEDARLRSVLGIAYAGLGRRQEAIQEGERAIELMPLAKDACRGALWVEDFAQIYVMVGEFDKAIEQLRFLLDRPSEMSIPLLQLDPVWDPLRDHSRFKKLVAQEP